MADTPQHPDQGGSYQRDPHTGALTPLHQTEAAQPELQRVAEAPNTAVVPAAGAPAADAGAAQEA